MAWPLRVYAATKTKGIYYTDAFTATGDQPVYGTINGGLAATTIQSFVMDTHEAPIDTRMFCIVGNTLYRRTTGDWAAIMTSAEACTVAGFANGQLLTQVVVDPITGYVYATLGIINTSAYAVGVMRSIDHGTTWSCATAYAGGALWMYGLGSIDAYDGLVVVSYSRSALATRNLFSTDHGVSWTDLSIVGTTASEALPVRINPLLADRWYAGRKNSADYWSLVRGSTAASYEALGGAATWGPNTQGGFWFDPSDVDHILTMQGRVDTIAWETDDAFATAADNNTSVDYISEIAEHSEDGAWVQGVYQSGRAHVWVSTDGYTLTHRSGAAHDSSPYADSIPDNAGGLVARGLWAVFESSSTGPTVPPGGGTITPPGGTPVTLVGTGGTVQAVSMPGYTGIHRGVPMPGDRAGWDETEYPTIHARDLLEESFIHHMDPLHPKASQEDFAGHVAEANPHGTVLDDLTDVDTTDVADGNALLYDLVTTTYLPADVLTPTEHTAIGNSTPHHAAVTLGAGNDAALALVGQELTLTLSAASSGEVLMADGVTAPPVPIETEDQTDWLYEG